MGSHFIRFLIAVPEFVDQHFPPGRTEQAPLAQLELSDRFRDEVLDFLERNYNRGGRTVDLDAENDGEGSSAGEVDRGAEPRKHPGCFGFMTAAGEFCTFSKGFLHTRTLGHLHTGPECCKNYCPKECKWRARRVILGFPLRIRPRPPPPTTRRVSGRDDSQR